MPNLNSIILTGADYKVVLVIKNGALNGTYPILTGTNLSWSDASENESIYAIGQEDPIGEKSNANKYSGKLTLQAGEINAILGLEGFPSAIRIRGAVLAVTGLSGVFKKTYSGINFNSANFDITNKSKESLMNIDFNALSIS